MEVKGYIRSSMTEYLQIAQSLGFTPLQLILIAMVYFMGVKAKIFPAFWKTHEEEGVPEKSSKDWFDDIVQVMQKNHEVLASNHFAHMEEKLNEVITLLKENNGRTAAMQECLKKANNTLGEFKEYGIKERQR